MNNQISFQRSRKLWVYFLSLLFTGWLASGAAFATDFTWNNANGGNYNVAANWTPNGVPAAGDNATIALPGTYTVVMDQLDNYYTLDKLTLGGSEGTQTLEISAARTNAQPKLTLNLESSITSHGQLNLGGFLSVNNSLQIDGVVNLNSDYRFMGPGTKTISTSGNLNVTRAGVTSGAIVNNGKINFTDSGNMEIGTRLDNEAGGLIDVNLSGNSGVYGNLLNNKAGATIRNRGDYATFDSIVNNAGTLHIQKGVFTLGNGSSSGTFALATSSTLRFTREHELNSATFLGAGTVDIIGSITAEQTLLIPAKANWNLYQGTQLRGLGTKQVQKEATLNVLGQASFDGSLTNFGTVRMAVGSLRGISDARFNNESGGLFDATTTNYTGLIGMTFNNKLGSTFRKAGNDYQLELQNMAFNNAGLVELVNGKLHGSGSTIYNQSGTGTLSVLLSRSGTAASYQNQMLDMTENDVVLDGKLQIVTGSYPVNAGDAFTLVRYRSYAGALSNSNSDFSLLYNNENLTVTRGQGPPNALPSAPTLLAPIDNSSPKLPLTFQLSSTDTDAGQTLRYRVELLQNDQVVQSFNQLLKPTGWDKTEYASAQTATLQTSHIVPGVYQWRGQTFDGIGWGAYSAPQNLVVDDGLPLDQHAEFSMAGQQRLRATLPVPQGDHFWVTIQKKGKNTNCSARLTLDGNEVASGSAASDFFLHLNNPVAGNYVLEIVTEDAGKIVVRASANLPKIEIGKQFVSNIYHNDGDDWAQLDLPAGASELRLTAETTGNVSNLAVWKDALTGNPAWTNEQYFNPPIKLNIANPVVGRYYLRIHDHGNFGSENEQVRDYSILSSAPGATPPVISGVTPNRGGNTGSVTLTIGGGNLDSNSTVKLSKAGVPDIVASSVSGTASNNALNAVFDLTGKTVGVYTVTVANPSGQSMVFPDAFTITTEGKSEFWSSIIGPVATRPNRITTYTVNYGNSGLLDLPSPLLIVEPSPGAEVSLDGVNFSSKGVRFFAMNMEGGATLAPEAVAFRQVTARSANVTGTLELKVSVVDGSQNFPWEEWHLTNYPISFSTVEWETTVNRARPIIGEKWEDVNRFLSLCISLAPEGNLADLDELLIFCVANIGASSNENDTLALTLKGLAANASDCDDYTITPAPKRAPDNFNIAMNLPSDKQHGGMKVYEYKSNNPETKETVLLVHGRGGYEGHDEFNFFAQRGDIYELADTLAKSGQYNVAILDWTQDATRGWPFAGAEIPASLPIPSSFYIEEVAKAFYDSYAKNLDPEKTIFVGESYGTYVSFNIAKSMFSKTTKKAKRLVALNPASNLGGYGRTADFQAYAQSSLALHTISFSDTNIVPSDNNVFVMTPNSWSSGMDNLKKPHTANWNLLLRDFLQGGGLLKGTMRFADGPPRHYDGIIDWCNLTYSDVFLPADEKTAATVTTVSQHLPPIKWVTDIVSAIDPNEKSGSSGFGPRHYVPGGAPLDYQILFENMPTSAVPAQEVTVTDQLDATQVDLNSFAFGKITFGKHILMPGPGLSSYTGFVDLRPETNIIVRVKAGLDKSTGIVTWKFESYDPLTGNLVDDPFAGFLPPNKTSPEGEGSLDFTIRPLDNSTDVVITNNAKIVFDSNDPINTNDWKNQLDFDAPQSRVLALPSSVDSDRTTVKWQGSDIGSGVASYTIYVSKNDAPFTAWLTDTTSTSATFIGERGKAYAFYSVARDNVGHVETAPSIPDASVLFRTSTQPPAQTPIPDLLIKKSSESGSLYGLNGVYQTKPALEQIETHTASPTVKASYAVALQNDGTAERAFVLKANETREAGWTLVYKLGTTDISAAIVSPTGFTMPVLAPGAQQLLTIEVTPSLAVSGGGTKSTTLNVYLNSADTTVRDTVQAFTTAAIVDRPDLLVKKSLEDAAFYGLNDVYQINAALEQIETQSSNPGIKNSFSVQLQNDGNTIRSYRLKANETTEKGWTVTYKYNNTDIGPDLRSATGYTSPALRPGAGMLITVEMLANATVFGATGKSTTLNAYIEPGDTQIRDSVKISSTNAVYVRPDLSIKTAAEPVTAYAIDNVYQAVPSGAQVEAQTATNPAKATYSFKIQNDGNAARTYVLKAVESAEAGWAIAYKYGATDISDSLRQASGFTTPNIVPGGTVIYTIEVTPSATVAGNAKKTVQVNTYLTGTDTVVQDTVQAITTCGIRARADLMVKLATDPDTSYKTDNLYTTTPTGEQLKQATATVPSKATYNFRLQNDGNTARSFVLKANETSEPGWAVTYKLGNTNITAALLSAEGYNSATLAVGGTASFTVEVAPALTVVAGTAKTVNVNAFAATSDTTPQDAIGIKTIANPVMRPDLLVKTASEAVTGFGLNDVYQPVPNGAQVKNQSVAAGASASYNVQLQNDGNTVRNFVLKAIESSESGWAVTYKIGNSNITAALLSAQGYTTPAIKIGGTIQVDVVVTPATTVTSKTKKTVTLQTSIDAQDTGVKDSVSIVTTKS